MLKVSAGQHLHLSADVKGNVSIAAQQGMQFTHGDLHGSQGGSAGAQQQAPMSSAQHSTGMPNNTQSTMNQVYKIVLKHALLSG